MSLSRKGRYYPIWRDFVSGKYTLCFTNEILTEYEEILTQKLGPDIAANVIKAILDLPNTRMVQVYYHLRLITTDPDDDKFVDCAFKTNARFIVTEDRHYDVLQQVKYPKINVIDIESFLEYLQILTSHH
jgi:putative PIN family toxin of toxin-antitoxin system